VKCSDALTNFCGNLLIVSVAWLSAVQLSNDVCRDILLLEVGFLTILLSPLTWFPVSRWKWFYQHDTISLWLVKWLLFRLMFSSGIVKLTSGCPTWWNLTGTLAYCVRTTVLFKAIDLICFKM
jgi:Lipase maturation factor